MSDDVAVREVLINGRWPLVLPEHRAQREEWATGWEPRRLDSMYANLRPGMVIYDIGTEEGDLSALFAQWVHAELVGMGPGPDILAGPVEKSRRPFGGIVLVEPNPRVWPNIRCIWDANGLPAPLWTLAGFCADHEDHVDRIEAGSWPESAYGPIIGDHGFLNVKSSGGLPVVTVDAIAERFAPAPDAITMDVEGAEILVARGMQETLRTHRPLVWVSVHAEAMFHDWHVYQVEFFSEFHRHGYEKAFLDFDHEAHWFFYPGELRDEVVLR